MPYVRREKREPEASPGEKLNSTTPRTNLLVEVPVYVLLAFTPLALGTVHLWSISIMFGIALLAYAALAFPKGRQHQGRLKLFPTGMALLCATVLTVFQTIPLPPFLLRLLNPGAGELFDYVFLGTGLWGEGNWRALSLDPPSTALEVIKFFSYFLTFLVVVNYFNDRHRARRLLKVMAWMGFGVAMIGFFSKLFAAPGLLGFYPVATENFFFSTFVNPNHLAGYLSLAAPISIGLALSARERQDRALYGFMGVITGVAVFMTLSRGGIVAFTAGCCFLFLFAATRKMKRLRHVTLVQVTIAGVLAVAGYLAYDTIVNEMRTLGDLQALRENDKINAWTGALTIIREHPVLGIGRGAFASVYPRFKSVPGESTFTHAENEVLQNMAEWGPLFGAAFVGVFALCFLLGLARARESLSMGGCLTGIFAVALQNLVDFNLETGGVALSFVAVLAIVAASPFSHSGGPRRLELWAGLPRRLALGLVPAGILAGALVVPYFAGHNLSAETEALAAFQKPPGSEPCQSTAFGEAACELIRHHPGDYLGPLTLGKAWLETRPPRLERAVHWLSRALYLNPRSATAHRLTGRALFFAGHRPQALGEYRLAAENDPAVLTATVAEVLRLTGDPNAAVSATPLDVDSYLATARILHNLGKDEAAAGAARSALDLNSTRIEALDLLGELALAAGRLNEAAGVARQASEIDPLHASAYWLKGEVLMRQGEPAKAEAVWMSGFDLVPDSTLLAYRLVDFYLSQDRLREADDIAKRLQAIAPTDDSSQAELYMLFGRIQEGRGMLFEARRSYRLASSLAPDTLPYLFRVAIAEERMGNWDEAERIFRELQQAHFMQKEIGERLAVIEQARQNEKNQALWDKLVDKKDQVRDETQGNRQGGEHAEDEDKSEDENEDEQEEP